MYRKFYYVIALLLILPAGLFSQNSIGNELKAHVVALTDDSLLGRGAGTKGEKEAGKYIEKAFTQAGLTLLYPAPGQDFSFVSDAGDTMHSNNIVGIIEGYDKNLKNEYILIGAHYDHLGYTRININGKDSLQIFSGADDNASGVAVMLELAKMVKAQAFKFRRSVLFVAFGAEERGMLGSWYFVNRGFSPSDKISLMINLDMIGHGQTGDNVSAYTITPHVELTTLLKDVADMPLMLSPKIHSTNYFPSDHQIFVAKGIPSALITTGLHRDYHTSRDVASDLDYTSMEMIANYSLNLAMEAANMSRPLSRTAFAAKDTTGQTLSKPAALQNDTKIYASTEVERSALFLHGGEQQFLDRWVYKYLKFPQSAIDEGIQGRVIVEFVIEKNGEVSNVTVVKSLDDRLDDEALKVVAASPKWRAATIGGSPVRVKMAVPVEFRLKRQ